MHGYEDTKNRVQTKASLSQQNESVTLQQINTEMLERINVYEKRLDEMQHQTMYVPKDLVHRLTLHALATHEDVHDILSRLIEQYLIAKETE